MPFNQEQWMFNNGYQNPYGSYGNGQGQTQPSMIQAQPRRASVSNVQPTPQMQQPKPYQSPFNGNQPAWMSGQYSGSGPSQPPAMPNTQQPINGAPVKYDWGGYTSPYGAYTQPGAYVPPPQQPSQQAVDYPGSGPVTPRSAAQSKSAYNDGFWDYDSQGYKLDSVGNRAIGSMGTGPTREQIERDFHLMKEMGTVYWPGSASTWQGAGRPKASDLTAGEKSILANGGDWNAVQQYRMFQQANGATTPATPTAPGGNIDPGFNQPPTAPPNRMPGTPGTPGTPGKPSNGGYQYPFANQPLEWYGQPANQQAVAGYWNAYLPMMEFQQNQANNLNNWNMDVWKTGWGMTGDQFNMGMDQAQLMNDYNNNLNILNSNDWSNQLQADVNGYGYGSQLYGNMYSSDNQLQGDYLNAQANQYGSYLNSGANLANTYANAGLGYDTLTNQYSIAQMNAMNDWYNQQARNQTDLQMTTMQAFGRDQAPNTRFLSNWG